jgi:hypothetical protein
MVVPERLIFQQRTRIAQPASFTVLARVGQGIS